MPLLKASFMMDALMDPLMKYCHEKRIGICVLERNPYPHNSPILLLKGSIFSEHIFTY